MSYNESVTISSSQLMSLHNMVRLAGHIRVRGKNHGLTIDT